MLRIGVLDDLPMVRQPGHGIEPAPRGATARNRDIRPARLEAEFAVGPGEAVGVMRLVEGRLAVDPTITLDLVQPSQPECCSVQSISSRALMSKPGCFAPRRVASPQITSWLERHSPAGSISFGPSWIY